jgi:TIR domain
VRTIFISHSTRSAPDEDIAYLEKIKAGLEEHKFGVWLDRERLKGGDDWNNKIGNHLVYCQGAVFLASKKSLDSEYVKYEVSNLFLRWQRGNDPQKGESSFPFITVVLSKEVGPELDKGFWGAIGLKRAQYIDAPADQAILAIVEKLANLPELDTTKGPLWDLERQIKPNLKNIDIDSLANAATNADFAPIQCDDLSVAVGQVTRALVTCSVAQLYRFFEGLGAGIESEPRRRIFELLFPSWVSHEAALGLDQAKACVINALRADFTPQMYLRRWKNALPEFAGLVATVTGVGAGTLAKEALHTDVRKALAQGLKLDMPPDDPGFDKALTEEIAATLKDTRMPILVVVPVRETDLRLVAGLPAEPIFEGITFVALCETNDEIDKPGGLQWLKPLLRPNQEHKAFRQYNRLSTFASDGNR